MKELVVDIERIKNIKPHNCSILISLIFVKLYIYNG